MGQIDKMTVKTESHEKTSVFFCLLIVFRFVINDPGTVDLLKKARNQVQQNNAHSSRLNGGN